MSSKEQHTLPVTKSNMGRLQALTSELDHTDDFEMDSQQGFSAYEEYRARIRREGEEYQEKLRRGVPITEAKEPVWDDELEEAFQEAVRTIPLIGKYKLQLNGKRCGRNELISNYIFHTTGRRRCRKQISSHIQVLKNILRNDSDFIKYVSNSKHTKKAQESSVSGSSKKFPKVTKRPYRKKVKQEQSRSSSPSVGTPSQYLQPYSQSPFYYGSPAPETTWPTKPELNVYDEAFLMRQSKLVSLPELLYQQPTSFSENFYPYSLDSQFSQQSWSSVTSDPTSQQAPIDPAMQTAIDPALTSAMDPSLFYLPSVYDDFSGSSQESEIETDDEFEGQYLATPNYPWELFTSHA